MMRHSRHLGAGDRTRREGILFELIKDRISGLVEKERRMVYEASFAFRTEQAPQYQEWMAIMQEIPQRDEVKIFLESEEEDDCIITRESGEAEYISFIQKVLEESEVSVKVEIQKSMREDRFSIFNFKEFSEDLLRMPLDEVMRAFALLFAKTEKCIIFELFGGESVFYTRTMFFQPAGRAMTVDGFDRRRRLQECREISYFYSQETYELLPDDFRLEGGYAENPLRDLFSKVEAILSVCYLASNATLQNEEIKFQIIGQRSVEYVYRYDEIRENPMFYKLYDWIHSGGNSIDKAIIARNIICLHCRYEPLLNMDEGVLASVQSSYNLYLKDNVTQYLELKGKIAEFISDIVSRTGEYATELLDRFKANLIAVFGFLFTVTLANIVSDQPLDNIFTRDITIILELVLAGSLVYLIICYVQSKYQMTKVFESYESLKKSYEGILAQEDIDECFQNNKLLVPMKKSIKKSQRVYIILWIFFLLALLVIIEMISDAPTSVAIWNYLRN